MYKWISSWIFTPYLWQPQRNAAHMSLQDRAYCEKCSWLTVSSCHTSKIHYSVHAEAMLPLVFCQIITEHSRGTRAGPVLSKIGLFDEQSFLWSSPLAWLKFSQNFITVWGSSYSILLPSLSPCIGVGPKLWSEGPAFPFVLHRHFPQMNLLF